MANRTQHSKWTHYLGMSASALCLVHCIVFPALLVAFPALAAYEATAHDIFWEYMFIAISLVSVLAIIHVHRTHGRFSVALPLALFGAIALTASLYMEHTQAIYLMISGSLLILCAHFLNSRVCKH